MTWRVTITAFAHSPLDSDKKKFAKDLKNWEKNNNRISSNRKEWLTAPSFVTYTDLLDLVGQYWHETNSAWNTLQWDLFRAFLLCLTIKGQDEIERHAVSVYPGIRWHLSYFPPAQGAFPICVRHAILGWWCICHERAQAHGGVSIGTAYLCPFTSRLSSTLN